MSLVLSGFESQSASRAPQPPLVLVVDDDRRVLELLQIALTPQRFRVITAMDGDEAIRRATAERPDLIVLDVRLPRKTGLEVCEYLRHDPDDPQVPIVLLSATADTDARLEGLSRGADDFLAKPFSPRELIARMKRLLARSNDARIARSRQHELEVALTHAQDEARRAHTELKREQRLRHVSNEVSHGLRRSLDEHELARGVLLSARRLLGAGSVVLRQAEADGALTALAGSGARWPELAGLPLRADGELGAIVAGLGRPVTRAELERFAELAPERGPLIAAGVALVAPLPAANGLEAMLLADERPDGRGWDSGDLEALAGLCEQAGVALETARRFRVQADAALAVVLARAERGGRERAAAEQATMRLTQVATRIGLPARERLLLGHALAAGAWGWSEDGRAELDALAKRDASGRARTVLELLERSESLSCDGVEEPCWCRTVGLAGVGIRFVIARASGRSEPESWTTALAWARGMVDSELRAAFDGAVGVNGD